MAKLEGCEQSILVFFDVTSPSHPSDTKHSLLKEFVRAKELEAFDTTDNLFNFKNMLYVYATGYEGKSRLVDWDEIEGSSDVPHDLTTLVMRTKEVEELFRLKRDLYRQ
jgi:hypothetical protein